MVTDDDPREAIELENAAEARRRMVDADPTDQHSAEVARHLQQLASEVRSLRDSRLYAELLAHLQLAGRIRRHGRFRTPRL